MLPLLLVILFCVLGVLTGIATGLLPGLHVNNIALILLSLSGAIIAMFSFLFEYGISEEFILVLICIYIISTSISHTFHDVIKWSNQLQHTFGKVKENFQEAISDTDNIISTYVYDHEKEDEDAIDNIINDFDLKARRLVHIGEVSYSDNTDPLALAVSQAFKTEKVFSSYEHLGCTQIVANVVPPLLRGLGLKLVNNVETQIAGEENGSMTYYLVKP